EVFEGRDFAEPLFHVPTVDPERTFLEKLFLLHEEFHRPKEKMRIDRLSRHLYDLYHLSRSGSAIRAINNKALYETIVEHRYRFSKVGGVNYNFHNPLKINPIPPEEVFRDWKADYARMMEDMIYEETKPSFADLIDNLKELQNQLQNLNWKFELDF